MTFSEARTKRKMTQLQLAEITGLSQTQLSRIEVGHVRPFLKTKFKIEAALGEDIDWPLTKLLGTIPSERFIHNPS